MTTTNKLSSLTHLVAESATTNQQPAKLAEAKNKPPHNPLVVVVLSNTAATTSKQKKPHQLNKTQKANNI